MKLCVDCKHFRRTQYMDVCESPQNGISLVTGDIKVAVALTNRKASPSGKCGPGAAWFEPHEPKPAKPRRRFWIF